MSHHGGEAGMSTTWDRAPLMAVGDIQAETAILKGVAVQSCPRCFRQVCYLGSRRGQLYGRCRCGGQVTWIFQPMQLRWRGYRT